MGLQSDYPPIKESVLSYNSPFQILQSLVQNPLFETATENGMIFIRIYKKSLWSKKKTLECVIEKIDDADENTKNIDAVANGKVFGVRIYEKDKLTYRGLYDCGFFDYLLQRLKSTDINRVMTEGGYKQELALQRVKAYNKMKDINESIEKLFE
jgi:hypothetical protein